MDISVLCTVFSSHEHICEVIVASPIAFTLACDCVYNTKGASVCCQFVIKFVSSIKLLSFYDITLE